MSYSLYDEKIFISEKHERKNVMLHCNVKKGLRDVKSISTSLTSSPFNFIKFILFISVST
jgi:hypothetical protein